MISTAVAYDSAIECLRECPLCGNTSSTKLPVPGNWIGQEVFGDLQGKIGLVECRGCGLVFTNPRPSGEKLFEFYSGNTYSCHSASGSASAGVNADFILKRVGEYLPQNAPRTLLDYGAGGGGFLKCAQARGWQVRGFEPGKQGLISCRQAGLDVTDQLHELPSGAFGLVTLHHVFEHLHNPVEVLDGIRTLLAPQGRLFIEVPNGRSLRARLAFPFLSRCCSADERYRAYPIHLMYYSERTLRNMLEKAQWKVEKTFTIGLGLDEFFTECETSAPSTTPNQANRPGNAQQIATEPKRRWRHALRDAFLGCGFGENVAAIAYPSQA